MKYIPMLIVVFLLIACQQEKVSPYEDGLAHCDQLREKLKAANPNSFAIVKADCIEGVQVPDFEAVTMDGASINRDALKGKLSILNFWFITCPPCVAEIPGLNAIAEKYGSDKINYIAIGRDTDKDIKEFLEEHPWSFAQIPNGNELIQNDFKIRWGYPVTYLLNQEAEIVLAFSGGKTDSTAVEEIQRKLIPVIERELRKID